MKLAVRKPIAGARNSADTSADIAGSDDKVELATLKQVQAAAEEEAPAEVEAETDLLLRRIEEEDGEREHPDDQRELPMKRLHDSDLRPTPAAPAFRRWRISRSRS